MTSAVIDEALGKADEIERKIQEFFDKVNDALNWVPDFLDHLVDPIIHGMTQLRQKMEEFWDRLKDLLVNRGKPDGLKQFADEWRESIGNRIGEIAGDIELHRLRTYTEWEGSAAEAYKTVVPPQSEGLEKIKSLAIQMNTSLKSLANGIEDFWTALYIAFGTFVVSIMAAIFGAASVVGIPVAIGALLTAVSSCIALVTTAIVQRDALEDTIKTEQDAIAGDWEPR